MIQDACLVAKQGVLDNDFADGLTAGVCALSQCMMHRLQVQGLCEGVYMTSHACLSDGKGAGG